MRLAMIIDQFGSPRRLSAGTSLRAALFLAAAAVGALVAPSVSGLWRPQPLAQATLAVENAVVTAPVLARLSELVRSAAFLEGVTTELSVMPNGVWHSDGMAAADLVKDLILGGETTVADREAALRKRLEGSLSVASDASGATLTVSVTGSDASLSASVANLVAQRLSEKARTLDLGSLDPKVEELARNAEKTEAALKAYTTDLGSKRLAALRLAEGEGRALSDEVVLTEGRLADLTAKLRHVTGITVADVLARPLPDSLDFTALDYQRQQHVEAKLALDALSSQLGPRHPRLLSAKGAVTAASEGVEAALAKLRVELRRQQEGASTHLAELKARQAARAKETAGALERLEALENEAHSARQAYEKTLQDRAHDKMETLSLRPIGKAVPEQAIPQSWPTAGIRGLGALCALIIPLSVMLCSGFRRQEHVEAEPASPEDFELAHDAGVSLETPAAADHPKAHDYAEPLEIVEDRPHPRGDGLLSERIREILSRNAVPAEKEQSLPPLLAAAMAGGVSHSLPSSKRPEDARQSDNDHFLWEQEVWQLQRDLAALRDKVGRRGRG